jgi:hypothetical protein
VGQISSVDIQASRLELSLLLVCELGVHEIVRKTDEALDLFGGHIGIGIEPHADPEARVKVPATADPCVLLPQNVH